MSAEVELLKANREILELKQSIERKNVMISNQAEKILLQDKIIKFCNTVDNRSCFWWKITSFALGIALAICIMY